jgi:anti-sigma B factor antagonist
MDVSAAPPFRVIPIESVRALRVEGELDLATAPELDQLLGDATAAGGPLVVDATGLSYMDSTGIHSLLHAAQLVARRGWCVYLHIDDGLVEEVLRLTGLDRMTHLHIIDHRGFRDPHEK